MGDGAQLVLENGLRVMQKAPDQRAFAIVHTPGGDETQKLAMINEILSMADI